MKKYCYESHLGGIFWVDNKLSSEERYCDECGDTDWLLGEASNLDEALKIIDDWAHPFRYEYDPDITEEEREWCSASEEYLNEKIEEARRLFV